MKPFIVVNDKRVSIDFFSSDQHIGHRNIARYTGRPFDNEHNTYHMDSTIQHNWNQMVHESDVVLVLGDIAMGNLSNSLDMWKNFNGTRLLVPGNHDRISSVESASRIERFTPLYEEAGFIILPEVITVTFTVNGKEKDVLASHYPFFGSDRDGRSKYDHLCPQDNGGLIIHGHTHSHSATNPHNEREYHVGVDAHNLCPVTQQTVSQWVIDHS